jgi:tRNA threonylcarbamoyladenosine biosynthesis protein TsaB
MITLALETSTPRGVVAVFSGDDLIFEENFTADRSHSSELFAVIERGLKGVGRPGQIIIGLGPGSYAGVRIAIAGGIGLAVATGAEMIGVPSILALADGEYWVAGDARRGGWWLARVRDGELAFGPEVMERADFERKLSEWAGPVYSSEKLDVPGLETRFPEIVRIGRLGLAGRGIWARGALEPIYLREPHITKKIDDR